MTDEAPPAAGAGEGSSAVADTGNPRTLVTMRSQMKPDGFDISPRELTDLHVPGQEADNMKHLAELGGVRGVAEKLMLEDLRLGIDNTLEEKTKRQEAFGANVFPEPPFAGWWALFFESFKDEILIILMIAAVVSLIVGSIEDQEKGWIDGVAIFIAILIVAVVTATNDYKKEQQFRALRDDSESRVQVQVIRDGEQQSVTVAEVLVGDVIHLETGDKIVADGLYISGNDFKTDESSITGESDTMRKGPETPMLLSGTTVAAGTCNMLATSVGIRSMQGKIMADTAMEAKDTPLQEKLNIMARQIGYFGTAAAILTFIALTVVFFANPDDIHESNAEYFIEAFIIAVTIIVVAIPEGLPLAVTISLAYSTRKMLADQNLIRVLAACETMGNATDICSDKTGTLTENRMTVVEGWLAGQSVFFENKETYHGEPADSPHWKCLKDTTVRNMLKDHLAINTTVSLSYDENKKPILRGSKTEGALVLLVESFGFKYRLIRGAGAGAMMDGALSARSRSHSEVKATSPSHPDARVPIVKQYAFTSERKVMSTLVRRDDQRLRLYVTGGSEFVLKRSTRVLRSSNTRTHDFAEESDAFASEIQGVTSPAARRLMLDEAHKPSTPKASGVAELTPAAADRMVATVIRPLAEKQYRTIGVAYRDFDSMADLPENWETSPDTWLDDSATIESDLTFYGVLGIEDPLREGVPEAVATCNKAGIRVRMVTGDNIDTARAIARQCGILKSDDDVVMEGPAFRKLTPAQVDDLLPRLSVLARSSPRDKNVLVRRLNGVLPKNQKEWEEEHPDMDWETQRDVTLPGYLEEWSRARRHPSGVIHKAVVGVTGDGTNDAPALKAADVGLSMGLSGTQVAKDSSDIVILDDRFSSIVSAVRWGRSVYDNIRKFLQFQLTVNVVALTLTFVAAVSLKEPPLSAVMMLWVNLIMDTMGALALGTEVPTDALLRRKPFAMSASLISTKMWRHILIQSVFQLIVTLFLLYTAEDSNYFGIDKQYLLDNDKFGGVNLSEPDEVSERVDEYVSTFVFNAFVFCQVFNEFNARSIDDDWNIFRGLLTNMLFICVIIITILFQAFIVEVGGDFTGTRGLTLEHWGWSVLFGLGAFPVGILMRLLPIEDREKDFAEYYDKSAKHGASPHEVSVEVMPGKKKVSPIEAPLMQGGV